MQATPASAAHLFDTHVPDEQSRPRAHADPLGCGPQRRAGTSQIPDVQSSSLPQISPFGRGPQLLAS